MNEVFPHESNKSGTIRGPDRLETLSPEQLQSTRVNFNCNESMIKDVVLSQSNTSAVLVSAHDALPNIDDHETSEHGRLMPTNMHSDLVDSKTSGHCDAVLPKISTHSRFVPIPSDDCHVAPPTCHGHAVATSSPPDSNMQKTADIQRKCRHPDPAGHMEQ